MDDQLENPVMGYVVIAAALIVGMLSATVFGQTDLPLESDLRSPSTPAAATESPLVLRCVANPGPLTSQPLTSQPPASPEQRNWVLGVRSRATEIGCLVTEVIAGTAAERVKLEKGDRIIAVNGQQVGRVGQELRPLHRAIDQSSRRHVRLLIQRRCDRELKLLVAPLQSLAETMGH